MRKDSKERQANRAGVDIASVQRYHGGPARSVNYAYNGFKENRYYTSDRTIKLDNDFNRPDGKPLKGIGLEMEVVSDITSQTVLAEVLDKIIFQSSRRIFSKCRTIALWAEDPMPNVSRKS